MAKFVLYDNSEGELQEFDNENDLQVWLKENFEGDVDDLQVYEVETEYEVEKSFDLKEV